MSVLSWQGPLYGVSRNGVFDIIPPQRPSKHALGEKISRYYIPPDFSPLILRFCVCFMAIGIVLLACEVFPRGVKVGLHLYSTQRSQYFMATGCSRELVNTRRGTPLCARSPAI